MLSSGKYHGDESCVLEWARPFGDGRVAQVTAHLGGCTIIQAMSLQPLDDHVMQAAVDTPCVVEKLPPALSTGDWVAGGVGATRFTVGNAIGERLPLVGDVGGLPDDPGVCGAVGLVDPIVPRGLKHGPQEHFDHGRGLTCPRASAFPSRMGKGKGLRPVTGALSVKLTCM